jgi:hypothetical protein
MLEDLAEWDLSLCLSLILPEVAEVMNPVLRQVDRRFLFVLIKCRFLSKKELSILSHHIPHLEIPRRRFQSLMMTVWDLGTGGSRRIRRKNYRQIVYSKDLVRFFYHWKQDRCYVRLPFTFSSREDQAQAAIKGGRHSGRPSLTFFLSTLVGQLWNGDYEDH